MSESKYASTSASPSRIVATSAGLTASGPRESGIFGGVKVGSRQHGDGTLGVGVDGSGALSDSPAGSVGIGGFGSGLHGMRYPIAVCVEMVSRAAATEACAVCTAAVMSGVLVSAMPAIAAPEAGFGGTRPMAVIIVSTA